MTTVTQRPNEKRSKPTIRYSDFKLEKLVINQVEDNKLNAGQRISIPKYKLDSYGDSLVQIQTPPITIFTYGIPKPGAYYKDDAARSFVKIPEDVNDPSSVALFKWGESIDKYMTSAEGKKKIFGSEKVANNYTYQPIVRTPEDKSEEDEDEDDENTNPNKKKQTKQDKDLGPRPRYMKLKIDLDWETKNIKTKVLVKNDEGKREAVEGIVSLDDINKYIRYKSTNTFVFMWNKIYASKNKLGDSKKYGAGFKITQALCEKPSDSKYINDEDAFIDDEEFMEHTLSSVKITVNNDTNITESSVKVDLGKQQINTSVLDNDEEDEEDQEDDDQEEEEEEDDEPVVQTKTPVVQTKPAGRRSSNK
jgi:hypothetical protein